MTAYITPLGEYYEGDRAHPLDTEVPQRPDHRATWDGEQWQAYQPTTDEIRKSLEAALDVHVDSVAASMGYRSMESCAGYSNSKDPQFNAEANAFMDWRDIFWRTAIAYMEAVLAGEKPIPTADELLAALPKFVRPQV